MVEKRCCGSICQHLHLASQELLKQPGGGWVDQPNTNKLSWLCLVPFSIVSKDRAMIYHKEAPGHWRVILFLALNFRNIQNSWKCGVAHTRWIYPGSLFQPYHCWKASVPAFHLTAAQLNKRDAKLIVWWREPKRDSSNMKTRGKCQSHAICDQYLWPLIFQEVAMIRQLCPGERYQQG